MNRSRYSQIMERVFFSRHQEGADEVVFEREDIQRAAGELGIRLPKNLGDVIYSFRYRASLPVRIRQAAPPGREWIIRPAGRSRYRFVATTLTTIRPNPLLAITKVPDSTPGIVAMYALDDEQALLAKLRYNRLIDIFTGITCYSLQNHLRTTAPMMGQIETDELYIGVDRRGVHYVIPVQAKSGKDTLSIVQSEQDVAMCLAKFPSLICLPVAAQFVEERLIALFALEVGGPEGIAITREKLCQLEPPDDITASDLETYQKQLPDA